MSFLKHLRFPLSLLILWSFSMSCNTDFFSDEYEEGIIHYTITYPEIAEDNYMIDLMPNKMTTSFKNGSYRSDIVAGMGLFKTSIICNLEDNKLIHSVKMLNKKYSSELSVQDIAEINPYFKDVSIEKTENTKIIAGFTCKEAIVTLKGDSAWQFNLYYTNEIKLDEPNRHTPFFEIDGVLMEYQMINYHTLMHFKANLVEQKKVDNKHLLLDEDYEEVSPTRLNNELESIFAKVQ